MSDAKKKYVIDTNVLIGFETWHPFKLRKDFWNEFGKCLQDGKYILLDVVAEEITWKGPLKEWIKKQKEFITSLDTESQNRSIEIQENYPMLTEDTEHKSTADVYIIAYAKQNGYIVFSREGKKKPGDALNKIPDTCIALGVKYIRMPVEFMTAMKI